MVLHFTDPMQLTISAKQLGRKQPLITQQVIDIEDIGPRPTVAELIEAVVLQQVAAFNSKPNEINLLPVMGKQAIDNRADSGKVGFGSIYNEAKADPSKAVATALLAFQDGMFVLFADEEEYTKPDQVIHLQEHTVITFIRLTFLAGSSW